MRIFFTYLTLFSGSPYAVVEYTCNPELGSDDDLKRLKKKLNDQGIELMLDFVPNHTAVDCAWTQAHPNWYDPHLFRSHCKNSQPIF